MRRRMKHDRNPLFVELQDKYKVKAYARERGVRTAETFHVTDKPETIPFDSLPDHYFIKANHGCGWNILCKDREFYFYTPEINSAESDGMVKHKLTRQEVLRLCDSWLGTTYSKNQYAYKYIPPMIMVEEILVPKENQELQEYKFYAFNGVVKALNVRCLAYRLNHENIFLDTDWHEFKLKIYKENPPGLFPEKPANFQEMMGIVEKLGKGLDFVRVDLYDAAGGVTLGEMTFYPYGGAPKTPTADPEFNQWLGNQWAAK